MVLSELAEDGLEGLSETIEEATDFELPDGDELLDDIGDFFDEDETESVVKSPHREERVSHG